MTRFLDEGILKGLYSDRSKIRSDKVGAERLEWLVTDCWCCDEFTRESKLKKHEIYDKNSRADDRGHR
eukprot:4622949-Pleurochrysis_carterae.AAC.1